MFRVKRHTMKNSGLNFRKFPVTNGTAFFGIPEKRACRGRPKVSEIDLSRIPTNNGAESRSGWTKIQQMYENVHSNLALVLLFERTEVECGKGLFLTRNFRSN